MMTSATLFNRSSVPQNILSGEVNIHSYNVTTDRNMLVKNSYFNKKKSISEIYNLQQKSNEHFVPSHRESLSTFGTFRKSQGQFTNTIETAFRLGQ